MGQEAAAGAAAGEADAGGAPGAGAGASGSVGDLKQQLVEVLQRADALLVQLAGQDPGSAGALLQQVMGSTRMLGPWAARQLKQQEQHEQEEQQQQDPVPAQPMTLPSLTLLAQHQAVQQQQQQHASLFVAQSAQAQAQAQLLAAAAGMNFQGGGGGGGAGFVGALGESGLLGGPSAAGGWGLSAQQQLQQQQQQQQLQQQIQQLQQLQQQQQLEQQIQQQIQQQQQQQQLGMGTHGAVQLPPTVASGRHEAGGQGAQNAWGSWMGNGMGTSFLYSASRNLAPAVGAFSNQFEGFGGPSGRN